MVFTLPRVTPPLLPLHLAVIKGGRQERAEAIQSSLGPPAGGCRVRLSEHRRLPYGTCARDRVRDRRGRRAQKYDIFRNIANCAEKT